MSFFDANQLSVAATLLHQAASTPIPDDSDDDFGTTEIPHPSEETAKTYVTLMGGEVHAFETHRSTTVSDVKALIHKRLGHSICSQKLILGDSVLSDLNARLGELGVAEASMLTLLLNREPLGQSLLEERNGKKMQMNDGGPPTTALNEFQLKSWQAASKHSKWNEWNDVTWGNLGCWGVDFYWTTRSDDCRYEYWSTAPGDNEFGVLVRVDADSVIAIAQGSDDGLNLIDESFDNDIFKQLVKEGWPRFSREEDEDKENYITTIERMDMEKMKMEKMMKKKMLMKKKGIKIN